MGQGPNIAAWITLQNTSMPSLTGKRDNDQCENGSLVNFSSTMPFAWHTRMVTRAPFCSKSSASIASWRPPLKREQNSKSDIRRYIRTYSAGMTTYVYGTKLQNEFSKTVTTCIAFTHTQLHIQMINAHREPGRKERLSKALLPPSCMLFRYPKHWVRTYLLPTCNQFRQPSPWYIRMQASIAM